MNGTTPVKVSDILADPTHQEIIAECDNQLAVVGSFHKASVLAKLKHTALAKAIRWDHIVTILATGQYDHKLVAVSERYFRRKDGDGIEQFVATGYGKRTAGWARASLENGLLAEWK